MNLQTLDALSQTLLNSAYVPVCISTNGLFDARYLRASPAYLTMIGRSWEEIASTMLVGAGAAIGGPARDRRCFLLSTQGGYNAERATIRHASGALIETMITAQRVRLGGENVDIEIFHPLTAPSSAPAA